ncbi:hypothetical protein [Microvirga roseola]|uniref:hypothetical protein n=1 Tax=Microvirga roseola TaxID=2883126 RepID=UPI001E3DFED1|nr:hypothetical protein [Microvirga roseola]
MGAEIVATARRDSFVQLNGFADTELVKLMLRLGDWALFGRVLVYNHDGDNQFVNAKILHHQNVPLDAVTVWATQSWRGCIALQATLPVKDVEPVTLECNTYKGIAEFASLFALRVDGIDPQ